MEIKGFGSFIKDTFFHPKGSAGDTTQTGMNTSDSFSAGGNSNINTDLAQAALFSKMKPVKELGQQFFINMGDRVNNVKFSADGKTAFVINENDNIYGISTDNGGVQWHAPVVDDDVRFHLGRDGSVLIHGGNTLTSLQPDKGFKKWEFQADVRLSDVYPDGNGTTYASGETMFSNERKAAIYSIDERNGAKNWELVIDGRLALNPVLTTDNTLLSGKQNEKVFGLDAATGKVKWEHPMDISIENAVTAPDGTAFFGTNGKMFSFDGNGKKWEVDTGIRPRYAPMLTPKGDVIIQNDDKGLALDGKTGEVKWEFDPKKFTPIKCGPDGTIYAHNYDGDTIIQINPDTGKTGWKFKGGYSSSLGVSPNGNLFVSNIDGKVAMVNPKNGKKVREMILDPAHVNKIGKVTEDDVVYINGCTGFYALNFKTKEEGMQKQLESMKVSAQTTTDNKEQGESSAEKPLTVEQGEGFVNIGGIKLEINKKAE
ncbi:MAG: PQQ-binding-like beta-propeller repeat protein [Firmicutes bacterium]|nr:PQQ-binding-like beta-propeller repeat protein [Bacillota bacterium]